jgi:hypothetical protein
MMRKAVIQSTPVLQRSLPITSKTTLIKRSNTTAVESTATVESPFIARCKTTFEVCVSKIFPAGFGWQYSSCIAADMGMEATDLGFFLSTGFGEFCAVLTGHSLYFAGKSLIADGIKIGDEVKTGFFLASAAFCSGTAWQPIVNTLQAANLPWMGVAAGTWITCGAAFYGGLRLARSAYPFIESPSYSNIKTDAALSLSIGGATSAFVGTDVVYLPAENPLIGVVGINETDAVLTGTVKAGCSTTLGFALAQLPQNLIYGRGKNWAD